MELANLELNFYSTINDNNFLHAFVFFFREHHCIEFSALVGAFSKKRTHIHTHLSTWHFTVISLWESTGNEPPLTGTIRVHSILHVLLIDF